MMKIIITAMIALTLAVMSSVAFFQNISRELATTITITLGVASIAFCIWSLFLGARFAKVQGWALIPNRKAISFTGTHEMAIILDPTNLDDIEQAQEVLLKKRISIPKYDAAGNLIDPKVREAAHRAANEEMVQEALRKGITQAAAEARLKRAQDAIASQVMPEPSVDVDMPSKLKAKPRSPTTRSAKRRRLTAKATTKKPIA